MEAADMELDEDRAALSRKLIDAATEISSISDYRSSVKKQYTNLARRLKLLTPMFEEIRDGGGPLPEDCRKGLLSLLAALQSAKELLRFGSEGSKLYLVLERDKVMSRFQEVTAELERSLSAINPENLDISDEVKEQVELVLAQFRRAKGRVEAPDIELYEDLLSLYDNKPSNEDPHVLKRLVEKLELGSISELTQESLALHELVTVTCGDPEESIEKMSMLLKKIKDFVLTVNPDVDFVASEKAGHAASKGSNEAALANVVIPDDFRCPISLELMKDPVIVSTGQTYERPCIEKWLEAGHTTCPKTQQPLTSTALTPNYVLRSLIAQWCEFNGIEPPKRPDPREPSGRPKIQSLIHRLSSPRPEDQRSSAGELRLLAKRNADHRVAIAEAGAIPLLVRLLTAPDPRTQEHAVTALLNLSICEENKGIITSSGAVPGIVHVLKRGSPEARENAAAALFSLSVVDENKVAIGASGAIPPLVALLDVGTRRGMKDAATALFNLCIYQGNKGKAVRAGVVPTLMRLLTEPGGSMVDESLAILAILSSHPEGKAAIGGLESAVGALVEVIGGGSPRNRENAAAVLLHVGDQRLLGRAREMGVVGPLVEMARGGTERGKRKAAHLLERMSRYAAEMGQKEADREVVKGSSAGGADV